MTDSIPFHIILVIVGVLVVLIVLTIKMIAGMKGTQKGPISDDLLKKLEKKDSLWSKDTINDAVTSTFDVLKKSYDSKKSHVSSNIMTINIYRDLFKNVVPNLKRLAFIEQTDLRSMKIIQVATNEVENRNSFTVMLDIEGELEENAKPSIYWTFIIVNKKWLLSEINEEAVDEGYFPG